MRELQVSFEGYWGSGLSKAAWYLHSHLPTLALNVLVLLEPPCPAGFLGLGLQRHQGSSWGHWWAWLSPSRFFAFPVL